jgi:polar amino acid transport system substrate-binding protein
VGLGFATVGRTVGSYDQARSQFENIVLLRGTIGQIVLPRQGFAASQLLEVNSLASILDLLRRKRADAWFDSIPVLKWILKQKPEITDVEIGPPVETVHSYLACSKTCAPALVESLRKSIGEIKADGTYDKILAKYQ